MIHTAAALDGYELFRRNRPGRRGSGVAVGYVRKWLTVLNITMVIIGLSVYG